MEIDVKHIFEVGGGGLEPRMLLLRIDDCTDHFIISHKIELLSAFSELPS